MPDIHQKIRQEIENEIFYMYENGKTDLDVKNYLLMRRNDITTMPNEIRIIDIFLKSFEEL